MLFNIFRSCKNLSFYINELAKIVITNKNKNFIFATF